MSERACHFRFKLTLTLVVAMNELDRFGDEARCDVRAVSMSSRWGGGGEWTPKEAMVVEFS